MSAHVEHAVVVRLVMSEVTGGNQASVGTHPCASQPANRRASSCFGVFDGTQGRSSLGSRYSKPPAWPLDRDAVELRTHTASLRLGLDVVPVDRLVAFPRRAAYPAPNGAVAGVEAVGPQAVDSSRFRTGPNCGMRASKMGLCGDALGTGSLQPPVGGQGEWFSGIGAPDSAGPEVGQARLPVGFILHF